MVKKYKTNESTAQDKNALMQAYEEYINKLLKQKRIEKKEANAWLASANDEKQPMMHFPNTEEAKQFFKECAQAGNSFLAFEADESGNLQGSYMISNGDGNLHEGKVSPETVRDLLKNKHALLSNPQTKAQVYEALKNSDELKLNDLIKQVQNPTGTMRTMISEIKSTSAPPPSLPEEEVESPYTP